MSFIGTVGVVAQQGNNATVSAPTSVSIATSSSGNYDDAFTSSDASGCSFDAMDVAGAGWSNRTQSVYPDVNEFTNFNGCDSASQNRVFAYLRATGATSFSWDLQLTSQSLSNSCVASVANNGNGATTQDCTGGPGVGEFIVITFGGGRGGATYPANGDTLVYTLTATATNSGGSTAAGSCAITYNFQ